MPGTFFFIIFYFFMGYYWLVFNMVIEYPYKSTFRDWYYFASAGCLLYSLVITAVLSWYLYHNCCLQSATKLVNFIIMLTLPFLAWGVSFYLLKLEDVKKIFFTMLLFNTLMLFLSRKYFFINVNELMLSSMFLIK